MSNYPAYPGGMPEPRPPQGPPPTVDKAVKLMYAGAVLALIGFIYTISTRSQLKRDVINANPHASSSSINQTVNQVVVISVIGGLIGLGIWIWMAEMNKRGKGWARILSSVFFGFDTLGLISTVGQSTPALSKVLAIATWLVGLGAILLLWRPDSTAFFNAGRYRQY